MTSEQPLESRLPSSLYCDLFYANPGADEFRRDHLKVWLQVELARWGATGSTGLQSRFANAYPGVDVGSAVLNAVVRGLIDDGAIFEDDDGKLSLTTGASRAVTQAEDRYRRSREGFLNSVAAYVAGACSGGTTPDEVVAIKHCVEELVIRVMLAEREALEVLYDRVSDFAHVSDQARRRITDLNACLTSHLSQGLGTRVRELRLAILAGFAKATDEGRNYLHTLNRSVVSSFFLIRDPHHAEKIRSRACGRKYFLDTNVYLAWLYPSQPAHEIVRPLMEMLKAHGAQVCVLPETVEEIGRIEAEARKAVARHDRDSAMTQYLVSHRKAIFTDYHWQRAKDPNLQFSTFSDLFTGPERTLPALGIAAEGVEFNKDEDFLDLIPTFRNAIRGTKQDRGRVVSLAALDHDARALVAMAKLQLRAQRDEWGSSTQYLSLDGALGAAVDECRNALGRRFERPMNPLALARLLLPTGGASLRRDRYEDFVVAAVKEDLGLLNEVSGYSSVELISKLERAGIPTPTLLSAPQELLEPALAQLQGRRDLNRKLDQALAIASDDDRRPILTEIQRDLEEAISVGSEILREGEARTVQEASEARRLQDELDELKRQLSSLSTKLSEQEEQIGQGHSAVLGLTKKLTARNWLAIWLGVLLSIALLVLLLS